jgi:hypothetical protein
MKKLLLLQPSEISMLPTKKSTSLVYKRLHEGPEADKTTFETPKMQETAVDPTS